MAVVIVLSSNRSSSTVVVAVDYESWPCREAVVGLEIAVIVVVVE